jgi:tetraacyldisaccharide 4'-kinase
MVYGLITRVRNWLFDKDLILRSTVFEIPIISVGNLTAGGTGKTPHTELILSLLQDQWQVAMLSRGYKRESKGFVLADQTASSTTIGDEPYQIHIKFPKVKVAVDEKRVNGINQLLTNFPDLDAIVLDDAFQHRFVQPGLSVLLTDYQHLYFQDKMLPLGRLRESPKGAIRANIIIVTKCPPEISPLEKRLVVTGIKPDNHQLLLFSSYKYEEIVPVFPQHQTTCWTYNRIKSEHASILLIAGIVSPQPIVEHLNDYTKLIFTAFFEDHHSFRTKDFEQFTRRFNTIFARNKLILLTEKDAARIVSNPDYPEHLKPFTYTMPIKVQILNDEESKFNQKILNYVVENPRNC